MAKIWSDAGHGGADTGCVGKYGFEKAIVLKMSLYFAERMRQLGHTVEETRTDDSTVTLEDRAERVKVSGVDLCISHHVNAYNGQARGAELIHSIYNNGQLAKCIYDEIVSCGIPGRRVFTRTLPGSDSEDYYYMNWATGAATVLTVEYGFWDNTADAEILQYRWKDLVEAVVRVIQKYYGWPYSEPTVEQPKPQGTLILAQPTATVKQAEEWARKKGATPTFTSLAAKYWGLASTCGGVNPVVAFAQAAKETGYGKFGGVIDASYCNPCGLKTTTGGDNYDPNAHARFNNWDIGAAAHMDHLAIYAGAPGYPKANSPDPRHFPYIKGKAPTVEALGGCWAPSATYGQDIVKLINAIVSTAEPKEPTPQEKAVQAAMTAGLVTDVDYWVKVLSGQEPVNLEYLQIAFNRAEGLKRG